MGTVGGECKVSFNIVGVSKKYKMTNVLGKKLISDSCLGNMELAKRQLETLSSWKVYLRKLSDTTRELTSHKSHNRLFAERIPSEELLNVQKITAAKQNASKSLPGFKNCSPSKYVLSDDEDEPFATDEDSDYQPNSSNSDNDTRSPSSPIQKRSLEKFREYHQAITVQSHSISKLDKCKKQLNFEDPDQTTGSYDSVISTSYGSGNSGVPGAYISTSTSPTTENGNVSSVIASFRIDLQKHVDFSIDSMLHKGLYKCNVIDSDFSILGFINSGDAEVGEHECIPPPQDVDITHIIIKRVLNTDEKASIQSEFCVPPGKSKGREINLSGEFYVTALRVSHNLAEPTDNKQTKGKQHYCLYCRKMFVEISNHLLRQHFNEEEVAAIIKMPVKNKQRINALKKLRLRGDAEYNMKTTLDNRIMVRKVSAPQIKTAVECMRCKSLLCSKNFARHERRCTGRPPNRQKVLAQARRANLEKNLEKSRTLKDMCIEKLIQHIRSDIIQHEIVSDLCLRLISEKYAIMHRTADTALKNDRQHLRRLARLLLEIKEIDPAVIDYEDCILFSGYDVLIEGVFRLCKLNLETQTFEKPALAQVLSSEITFLLETLRDHYIEKELSKDSLEWKNLDSFMIYHKRNYSIYVGRTAGRTRLEERAKKKDELPSPADVQLFVRYICEESETAYNKLTTEGFSYEAWLQLGKAELAKIIVFNRRRVTEVGKLLVDLYKQRTTLEGHKRNTLTLLQRQFADTFTTMAMIGKKGHILHILLDIIQCRNLDIFLNYREQAGVDSSNKYLFGVPTVAHYIDASNVLREFSFKCKAQRPDLLRTTYLRKQVATLAQLLNMDDNQIGQVAKLMGHTQKVHEQFYRQDESLFQFTSWAKFLSIVSEDDIGKYKGKTFDDIIDDSAVPEHNLSQEDHITVEEILATEEATLEPETESDVLERSSTVSPPPSLSGNMVKRLQKTPNKSPKGKQTIDTILHTLRTSPRRRTRISFKSQEINIMRRHFSSYISSGFLPKLSQCEKVLGANCNIFVNRCARDLYNWVQYQRNVCRSKNK